MQVRKQLPHLMSESDPDPMPSSCAEGVSETGQGVFWNLDEATRVHARV